MKKMLSVLSVLALLLILFSVCAPIIGAEDVTTKSPLMVDFTTQAKFDVAIAGQNLKTNQPQNGSFSYDAGAAKITLTGTANQAGRVGEPWLFINPTNQMPVAGNEVVVVKMKINCTREKPEGFMTYAHYTKAGDKQIGYENHTYKQGDADVLYGEDGWIYAAYTSKTAVENAQVAADATWGEFRIIPQGDFFNTNDSFSIAWVGAFKDLATAKRWDETGSTEAPAYAEKFFFDFTDGYTQTAQQKANNETTTLAYDAAEKALKVSITADAASSDIAPIVLLPVAKTDASIATHPYFALKVKANGANVTASTTAMHPTKGISWGFGTLLNAEAGYNTYSDGEWTLIIMNANAVLNHATYKEYMGTDTPWLGVIYNFAANAAAVDGTAKGLGWIQWAGAFDSIEGARNYFAATTEQEEEMPKKEPVIFADYTTRAKFEAAPGLISFNRYGGTAMSDTTGTKAYDDEKGALVFTTVNRYSEPTNRPDLNINVVPTTDKRLLLKDVNVLAIKSELGEMADPYATLYAHGIFVNGNGAGDRKSYTTLEVTDSFIFLTIDHAAAQAALGAGYDTATIWGYVLFLNSNTYPENGTTVAIEWAGAFDSKEEAEAYTIGGSDTDSVLVCTTAGIRKELDTDGNQGLRFYQTLKTKLIGDKEYATYNDEMLEVKTVHVLMATESTLKSVGLTAEDLKSDLVGSVAKVAQIKVTNCRSRVVDGDNVTYTFTAMLTGVGQVNKSTDVCAVAYVRCKNAQGEWVEVYGNVQTTSVKTMYKAIGSSKFSSKIQQWMVGRADGLFLDFVSEATMSQVAVNTKSTAISYSAENSAVYISPLEDGIKESNTIHLYPTGDVSVEEYPVFAMRVKLANPDLQYGSFYWRTEASNELYTKVKQSGGSIVWMQRVPGTEMTYEATDGWQIIYTDMSKVHNPLFTGNWEDVMNVMAPMNGKGVTTADGVYIDWMGAFATVEDAHDYANVDWEREEEPVTVLTQEEQNAKNNAWQINNNLSSEMEKISVETYLVDGYDPDTDQYAFRHHPSLAYFQGKWYAGFSNGVSDEDAPGQKMVYSVSENCKDWSDPIDIVLPGVAAMGTENRSAGNTDLTEKGIVATQVIGGFSVVGDRLYFYYTVQEYARSCFDENGVFKGMDGAVTDSAAYRQYGIYTTDGVTWSTPKAVSSLNRYSTLQQSPYGTQQWYSICGFRIHYTDSDIVNHNTVLSSGMMTQEQILSSRERCPGSLTETSYYQSPDGVLHLLCRSETGYIWAATSTDEGKTWSELYPTNFTSASTMFNCIFLPDGRIAWVGSPYYDTRWPLTLYISEDGYNFDKAYILQDEIYEMQEPDPQGWAKGGAFAYPQLLIEGDYLYILYTKQKEVVEICRVKLSNIP